MLLLISVGKIYQQICVGHSLEIESATHKEGIMENTCTIILRNGESITTSDLNEINSYFKGLKITFYGDGSRITLYEGTKFSQCLWAVQKNSFIEIGLTKFNIIGLNIYSLGSVVKIGKNFSCWGCKLNTQEVGSSITIGDDCMFSSEILLYATDVHTIYDIHTLECVNFSKPITIGNHVWVGRCVKMLKGASVNDNSVVGMGTIVTKSFPETNIILAGSPAHIVRRGINWSRESPLPGASRAAESLNPEALVHAQTSAINRVRRRQFFDLP